MYNPICIQNYMIYDIFHNDTNHIIIISPNETNCLNINYIEENIKFKLKVCPHNHTYIYISDNTVEYKEKIKLKINNEVIETRVNKYPECKNMILMSTLVLNEDNYIKQWINFHSNIGIDKFIIYDNAGIDDKKSYHSIEKNSDLKNLLKDYIENKKVILIKWPYPKRLNKSGLSGQTTQQNHSIYAFQNSKYIGLFDIDEYVNMQNEKNIKLFFEKTIKNYKINTKEIGGFHLYNKYFYNPLNLPTNNYNFLKIYNCSKIIYNMQEKIFIIPKNIETFSIHVITRGKKAYILNEKEIYFNHYFFLNKKDRGKEKTNLIDKTIIKHTSNLFNSSSVS